MKGTYLVSAIALLFIGNAHAADIASEVRSGTNGPNNADGGYLEFGVDLKLRANNEGAIIKAGPLLAGAYRYRGFFFEALTPGAQLPGGPIGGVTLGYNLWHNDQWAVDLLGASSTWGLSLDRIVKDVPDSQNTARDRAVWQRNSFYNGAGLRVTGYFGDTIFQYRLVSDTHGGKGITSSARLGYSQQVKNWNFHGVLSANYTSQKTGQYWFGVSDEEATTRFPQYDVDTSTISYSAEIGATYPVRENVVFRSTARYTELADAITRSPIVEGEASVRWDTSLSYVF